MSHLTPNAASLSAEAPISAADARSTKAPASSWYALAVLLIATLLGGVDKIVLTLLTEPVRVSLSLSDTQIGLLQGVGLVLFTGIATLPLGWLSDRYDRRIVLAACVLLWSAATGLRGTAQDYGMLFVASIGLGVGEAGLTPITNSMIPDLFSRAQRVLANTIFALSAIFGAALGAMLGGVIVKATGDLRHLLPESMQTLEPWRLTFFAMASLGIPVALLVLSIRKVGNSAIKAPDANASAAERAATLAAERAADALEFRQHMVTHWRTFAGLVTGIGLATVGLSSIGSWLPIYTARTFGVSPAEVGRGIGLAFLFGTLAGGSIGFFSIRLAQRFVGPAAALRVIMLGNVTAALLSILLLFVRSANDAFMLLGLMVVPLIGGAVAMPNVLQDASPARLRSRTIALLTMASLPFAVLGPLAIGMLSDGIKSNPNGLAIAIVATTLVGGLLGAAVLRISEGPFVRLMRAAHTDV